jgi:hypothetical protein
VADTGAYENQPRRRRDDDLTVNEWRLLRLEKIADNAVQVKDFEDLRIDVSELRGSLNGDIGELRTRIDALKTWIVATAIAVCSVVMTALGLSLTMHGGH